MRIIQRHEWGARHSDGFRDAPLPAREVWLHHSVTLAPDLQWIDADRDGVDDDEERAMRTLEDIGQDRFGGGISYTFLVMPSGRVYEGHSVGRQGAHTGGRNDIARAICLVGNYEANRPTEAQVRAVAELLRYGKAQGWWKEARLAGGHRDLKATACPGRYAYERIAEINALAAQSGGGGSSSGSPQRRRYAEEEIMPVRLEMGRNAQTFQIPKGAKKLAINCPHGKMTVTALLFAGDGYPSGHEPDGLPKFAFKGNPVPEGGKTIHRLRPWRVEIPKGATQGGLYYDFPVPDKRYTYFASLDFIFD